MKARRPVHEVKPVLGSLSRRLLIGGATVKGVQVYGLLPIWPGIFETQMLREKTEGGNAEYYKEFARLFEEVYNEYLAWAKPKVGNRDIRIMRPYSWAAGAPSVAGASVVPCGSAPGIASLVSSQDLLISSDI